MDFQQTSIDLSSLAQALPSPPASAEQDKVVASLAALPPELKLKIVEEVYEAAKWVRSAYAGETPEDRVEDNLCSSGRLTKRGEPTDLAALSLVDKQWHGLCAPKLWKTLKLVGHSCLSLFFLLDDVLPRYYQHVHYLVVGQKEEDELFPASATHQDAQKKKHLLTRIKQLDQAAFSASRTTSDVGTAKDVLTAEIVRSCNNLLEVDVDPVMNQEGCLHKTLCILWSARLANLQGIRLTASPPLAEHADAILASSQSSLSLGRLSLDLGDDRPLHNLTVRLLILLQSLKQLKDLDIDIVFSGILGSVRLDAPVKRLRLELSDGIPLLSLKQFLEPIRYTLRRLVLANFRCGVDFEGTNFPTLNLPSLSDLILYDGQASPLPLKLFPFSPIQHIYLDECLLYYLPKLLSTIQPFVNTLQTFSFGERVIVAQSYEVKQTQTTVNAIKGWLAAHEVDNNFPAEVLTPDKARWRFW